MNNDILIFTDPHIGEHDKFYTNGMNLKLHDIMKSCNYVVDYASEHKIKDIIIIGDVFKTRHPSVNEMSLFNELITKYNIRFHIVLGNHDYINEQLNTLTPLVKLGLKNVFIYDTLQQLNISSSKVLAIPHNEQGNVNNIKKMSQEYDLIVGHIGLNCLQSFKKSNSFEDYFDKKKKQLILLGHYHNYTEVNKNCYFIGDIVQLTFAEASQKKYFCIYNKGDYKFIEIPTRRLIEVSIEENSTLQKINIPERSIVKFVCTIKIDRAVIIDYCIKNKLYLHSIIFKDANETDEFFKQEEIKMKSNNALLKDYLSSINKLPYLNTCQKLIDTKE